MTREEELEKRLEALEAQLGGRAPKTAQKRSYRSLVFVTTTVVLLALGGLGFWLFTAKKPAPDKSPFSASIQQSAKYPLYYPTNLPDGLEFNQTSISNSEQAVTYSVTKGGMVKYQVSIQAMPKNFDFSAFKKKFQDGDEFTAPAGSVFIGDAGNGLIGSIRTTDGSWIIITTPDYNAKAQISELSRAFRKEE